jgi:hypothetical protein
MKILMPQRIYFNLFIIIMMPNVEVRLEAVTGLLKIAVFKVKLAEADSLNTIGNSILIKEPKVSIATRLRFNQATAEYYRSSAQFDAALKLHQKVLKESQAFNTSTL